MSTPYRFIPEEAKRWKNRQGQSIAVVEVTVRTILGIYLLKPTDQNTRLILGILGRAKALLGFELYGYAYLSNHGSILLGVRDADHLARAMEYIHSNIARELGRKENSDWQGRFWGRRGRAIVVLTDEDLVQRMKYLLANSTKEGLVSHPSRWPGAHCAQALCDGRPDVGTWINRTELRLLRNAGRINRTELRLLRNAARASDTQVSEADATTYYRIELEQLPCWSHLSAEQYKQRIRSFCNDIREQAVQERARTGRSVLGAKRLLRLSPHHRPDGVARSPAPPIHCRDSQLRLWFVEAYKSFVDAYKAAYGRLHQVAISGEFPPGGVPPTRMVCALAH